MATSYVALVSLMNVLNRIQLDTCPVSFNLSQIQSLYHEVDCLVTFLVAYYQLLSNALEKKITEAAFAAEDMIELYLVDQILAGSSGERDADRPQFIHDLDKAIQDMNLLNEEVNEVKATTVQQSKSTVAIATLPHPSGKGKMVDVDEQVQSLVGMQGLGSSGYREVDHDQFSQDLVKPTHDMNLIINEEANEVEERNDDRGQQSESTMVGVDEQLQSLMDQVTSDEASRLDIPIVGMGGIGKSTLARNVYEDSRVMGRFDVRLWVTISQNPTIKSIIIALLRYFGVQGNSQKTEQELRKTLYQNLFPKRYLIILDDVWSSLSWDDLKQGFPDKNNSSRILLTTRHMSIARTVVSSCSTPCVMELLDNDKSWCLLSQSIFGSNPCPRHLEKLGKKIAKSCNGLPMAILVIGGLLKSEKTREHWYEVDKKVISITSTETESHFIELLSLSYHHLPIHLKACFLYMATFIEGGRISTTELINLWVVDGLLKPEKGKTLEDLAVGYLRDLKERNLIVPPSISLRGQRIEYCSMHDSLREFCLEEAERQMFLYPILKPKLLAPQNLERARRLVYHPSGVEPNLPLPPMPLARSFYCDTWSSPTFRTPSRLLRVLRVYSGIRLQIDTAQLVNLRYLACQVDQAGCEKLLSSISLFWNLEVLIVSGTYKNLALPSEFWEFKNLKCAIFANIILPVPSSAKSFCVLENLRELKGVKDFDCTDDVLARIPNLRELSLYYSVDNPQLVSRSFNNLARHENIKTLRCEVLENKKDLCIFDQENLKFSPTLRELELSQTNIPWEWMTIISLLPELEALTLRSNAFRGKEWNIPNEEEFQNLRSLSISGCDLRKWEADSSHFPRLEHLYLECPNLESIPLEIEEAEPLTLISFFSDKKSLVLSANEMLYNREENSGNDDLLVEGVYVMDKNLDEEGLQQETDEMLKMQMRSNNFQVQLFDHKAGHTLDVEEFLSNTKKRLVDMWKLDSIGGNNTKKQIIEARRYTQYKGRTEVVHPLHPAEDDAAPDKPDNRGEWLGAHAIELADLVDVMYNLHTRQIQFEEIRDMPAAHGITGFIDQIPEAPDSRAEWLEERTVVLADSVGLLNQLYTRRMQNLPSMTEVTSSMLNDAIRNGSIFSITWWRNLPSRLAEELGISDGAAVGVLKAMAVELFLFWTRATVYTIPAIILMLPGLILLYLSLKYGFFWFATCLYLSLKFELLFPFILYFLPTFGVFVPFRLYISFKVGGLLFFVPYLIYLLCKTFFFH